MIGEQEKKIIQFCKVLMSISATNLKKEWIKENSSDNTIKYFLSWLLDKMIVTGISTKKISKDIAIDHNLDAPFDNITGVLAYLEQNSTGADKDIVVVQRYLHLMSNYVSEEDIALLKKIITKSLRLGVDTKLVNAVIPNLIRVHEVQQANSLKNVKLDEGEWICLSEKLNGNRATWINGKLISRQGKEFNHLDHILKELSELQGRYPVSMVFDGEIRRKNIDHVSDNENFTIGTGILNSDSEDKSALSFIIFDMLPLEEFNEGESKKTYKERYYDMEDLDHYLFTNRSLYNNVEVVPFLYAGNDHSEIEKCLAMMDAAGKEGCMLARDVPYYCKRHNGLLKVKTFYTMDLPIVGFENGTGKNEWTLGKVIVQYKDNTVGVGSGFSDEERDWFWEHQDELMGRIIEVKYKDISKDKGTGKESLQFPTFVQLREEGKGVSYA